MFKKKCLWIILIILLLLLLFRFGSYLLLPSEPVALVPGLRYSAGPLSAVLRLGLPKAIENNLSQWGAAYYKFYAELDGVPAEINMGFADGLWLTELWVRAEAENSVQADAFFHSWCERLEETYQNAEGYQTYGITETCSGKALRLEINKGALLLSCVLTVEGNMVCFYGNNLW